MFGGNYRGSVFSSISTSGGGTLNTYAANAGQSYSSAPTLEYSYGEAIVQSNGLPNMTISTPFIYNAGSGDFAYASFTLDLVNNSGVYKITGFDAGNPFAASDSTTRTGWGADITYVDLRQW